ncbi:hypothetical protein DFH08DRAFT_798781 [Mycena albidolilacea]|uniref:Uncharacterized protein n=1 Tax=Mycena albidolilacea TaxID=1033008 RepID=A0AAD7APD5_9AGAR|nr:hypothetical protein DFH08DRAFT_798781 [Mycena albidolilacea]
MSEPESPRDNAVERHVDEIDLVECPHALREVFGQPLKGSQRVVFVLEAYGRHSGTAAAISACLESRTATIPCKSDWPATRGNEYGHAAAPSAPSAVIQPISMGYPTLLPSHRPHPAHPELPAARARCPHSGPMIGPRSPFRDPHFTAGIRAHRQPAAAGEYCRMGAEDVGMPSEGCLHRARALPAVHTQQFIRSTASPLQRGDGERGAAQWERTGARAQGALAPLQAGFGAGVRALRRGDYNRVGAAPGRAARGRGGGAYAVQPARTRTMSMLATRVGMCGIEGWCVRVIADERRGACSNTGAEGPWRPYRTCPSPARALLPVRAGIFASAAHNFFQMGDTPECQPASGAHAPLAHRYSVAEVLCWQPQDARSVHPLVHDTLPAPSRLLSIAARLKIQEIDQAMRIEDPVVVPAQHGTRAFLNVIGKDLVKNEAPGKCTLK